MQIIRKLNCAITDFSGEDYSVPFWTRFVDLSVLAEEFEELFELVFVAEFVVSEVTSCFSSGSTTVCSVVVEPSVSVMLTSFSAASSINSSSDSS